MQCSMITGRAKCLILQFIFRTIPSWLERAVTRKDCKVMEIAVVCIIVIWLFVDRMINRKNKEMVALLISFRRTVDLK